ncbi:hypothetical protein JCM19239_3093 [Vibrio variabilis]|uniref:Uncharacterized protein n=2 Tax=Vibrio TaxID=662 RepID=A0ABQ0J7C4_9VIBR|nr:hypothetical protein JCM19239_3093 [Vibrio variabilis]
MQIVDKRLRNQFGRDSALKIEVETQRHTRMSFIIPAPVNSDDKRTAIAS